MEASAAPAVVDIFALGEPMVEFNQTGEAGGRQYLQGFGGDTSNFAIAAARQGARVGYLSALGPDPYGQMLRELWDTEGVDHRSVATDDDAYTAIYFVTHGDTGHQFHFFRKGSAASRIKTQAIPRERIKTAKVLHFSGISLAISETAREACFAAVEMARQAGVMVSFDTNLRLKLWPMSQAREVMRQAIALSDLCLPSFDDLRDMTGLSDPEAIVGHCLRLGAKTVALKLGAHGALIGQGEQRHVIAPFPCRVRDATGAGDTFGGAFVARLVAGDSLPEAGRYAAIAAALSTEGYGAVAPIPHAGAVKLHLA
jgi:2-dehydro-3-deoxygluconokinase